VVYVLIGVLALVLGVSLVHIFVKADPIRLAQVIATLAVGLGALISALALGIGILERSPLFVLLGLGGFCALWYGLQRGQRKQVSAPRVSAVETDYLRMHLDHDSGVMSGTVRRGRFQGRHLAELAEDELIELWRSCRAEDPQAARLMEAYLDRLKPDWRGAAEGAQARPRGASDTMTREEAYAILGLKPDASDAEVREAHHRLMMGVHPDHGGSTYLAAKLNRAREVLLGA
jgi:DnaJ domain